MEKFAAGADLVQLISGMIFTGPGLVNKICTAYAVEHTKTS
jgi:dihydroorotate dehydrogenase